MINPSLQSQSPLRSVVTLLSPLYSTCTPSILALNLTLKCPSDLSPIPQPIPQRMQPLISIHSLIQLLHLFLSFHSIPTLPLLNFSISIIQEYPSVFPIHPPYSLSRYPPLRSSILYPFFFPSPSIPLFPLTPSPQTRRSLDYSQLLRSHSMQSHSLFSQSGPCQCANVKR